MRYDIIKDGWHELSGFCDTTIIDEYCGEELNAIIVRIDDKNYLCYEDPEDGYRSRTEFKETDEECSNIFPPQRVMVKHYKRRDEKGMEFYNPDFELILLVGTDYYDDYYPVARYEWHPENLPINKGIHKDFYTMPGELTMKVNDYLMNRGNASADEILDDVNRYYQDAYNKGVTDTVKAIERSIVGEYGIRSFSSVGDYVCAVESIVSEIQKIDKNFKIDEN